jgi:hypothetical protein
VTRGALFTVAGDVLDGVSKSGGMPGGLVMARNTAALLLQFLQLEATASFERTFDALRFGRRVALRLGRPRLVAFDERHVPAGAPARLPQPLSTSWPAHDVFVDMAVAKALSFRWVDAGAAVAPAAAVLGDALLGLDLQHHHATVSAAHRRLSLKGNHELDFMLETLLALSSRALLEAQPIRLTTWRRP